MFFVVSFHRFDFSRSKCIILRTRDEHCKLGPRDHSSLTQNDVGAHNRPLPTSLVPLFQSESKCETNLMKMTLICIKRKLHAELIFTWKVSHLDSFWNRGTRELWNGLLWRQVLVLHVVFALGQKQAKIGFTLTKFLQEKHTSLRGTISDVTQVNVDLQEKNNGQ